MTALHDLTPRRKRLPWAGAALCLALLGCIGQTINPLASHSPVVPVTENPVFIAASDRNFLWDQLVDTVDDYFLIEREQRVQRIGDVLTEGRLDTLPQIGATALEPWRRDSTPGFERWQSTFQTIRRRATARMIPAPGGFLVEVVVIKEIEDLTRPQHATAGEGTPRHDNSLETPIRETLDGPLRLGWIPLGRDTSLETVMLGEYLGRVAEAPAPRRLPSP